MKQRGFTLVELILVMVITGIVAAVLVVFVRPALDSYLAQRRRAELQGAAMAALQAMVRDVRAALPNSIRTPSDQCIELIPTVGGGRYRQGPDTLNDASACASDGSNCAAFVDTGTSTARFDVLGAISGRAAPGDSVVIGNQNGDEAYAGSNRAAIASLGAPPNAAFGTQRVSLNAARQFPTGYAGARFFVVGQAEPSVFLHCQGAGVDANGDGTGTLYRKVGPFSAAYPTSCPSGGEVLATQLADCSLLYDRRSLSEFGLLSLRIELARGGERLALQQGAMVSNIP